MRKQERLLKDWEYTVLDSCANCEHVDWGYEGEVECKRLEDAGIHPAYVDQYGICKKYENKIKGKDKIAR